MTRDADGPAVILHDQDDRSMKDTCEVQCFVEIAFGRGTIATHAHGYDGVASDFGGHCQAHGMQHLCADHNLNGQAMHLAGPVFGREATKRVSYRGYRNALDE